MVQETFINSKYSELRFFNDSKWTMKNIKMKLSWRQITFRFCLLVRLSWNTVSYVIYNIEESEVALDFCQKVPSNYCILQCQRKKNWVHMHISYIQSYNFLLLFGDTCFLCSWNICHYRFSYGNWRLHSCWWQFTSFLYFYCLRITWKSNNRSHSRCLMTC